MADKSKVIRIPDIAPIGFENLLRYAYTDSLNLNSVEDAMLTAYAAKKYLLPHLLRECLAFINKNITPSCACAVYEFATVLNSQQLVFQAMQIIDRQTYHVTTHKTFNSIQLSTLEFIVSRRYLNLYSEYSLFNSIIQWALTECKRRSLNSNDWVIIRNILEERAIGQTTSPPANQVGEDQANQSSQENSLLTKDEKISIFMNLAIPGITTVPRGLCQETTPRTSPPEYFIVRRYKPTSYATATSMALTGSNKSIRSVSARFQVMNTDLFITGASIPIRLDPGYYSVRTPKLECQLKFSSKVGVASEPPLGTRADDSILLDTVDDSINLVISKDKDCSVKLKKPISIKRGNLNELLLTFQLNTLNEDIVLIKGHKAKANQNEIIDGEAHTWIFYKTNNLEFNELYYYY